MRIKHLWVAATVLATTIGAPALAQDADRAVKARISLMQLYSFNLGTLGAMAKGEMAYDAGAASAAADSLVALSQVNQSAMWPQGTEQGAVAGSRALAKIWTSFPDVAAKGQAFTDAAAAMQDAAGMDLASLQAAMGPLGGSCSGCHKAYRGPKN